MSKKAAVTPTLAAPRLNKRLASCFIVAVLVLFLVAVVGANGQPANSSEPKPTNIQMDLTVAEVETDLSANTTSSTKRLIATLEGLQSKNLYYQDNYSLPTEEGRMNGPPMYDEFVKITNELANRGGESVWQGFEQILIGGKLIADEKKIVRNCFRTKTGEDAPFTLPACDRIQTRQYWLLFDPKKCKSLTVRQGDMLTQIARKAYPKLSQWDGIDILVFINDLKNEESIRAGQTINVYEYKIIKNEPAQ